MFVQVEFQAVPYTSLRLRLHDASGLVVAAADFVAAPESDIVHVLDEFTFGQTPVGIESWTWGGIKAVYLR